MRFGLCLVAAVLAAAPGAAFAGELSGSVIDARGLPVAGIEVSLDDRTTQTDAEGRYAFADVAVGEASIAVHKANGDVQRAFADVAAEGVTRRDLFLVSAGALSAILSPAQPAVDADVDLGETLRLADQMVDAVRGEQAAWRWNDREA